MFPASSQVNPHHNDDLVSQKIYLFNKTISKHEQRKWFLPKQFPELQSFNISFDKMWSAIQNPDNERMKSILLKAFNGKAVDIVVYGGSNTAAGLFPPILQKWWDKNIFPISGSVLKIKNIAIGGTSSTYFQFCYDIYLDKSEVVDLFILELSINDALCDLQNSSIPRSLPFEKFTTELLKRPNKPSVLLVNLYILLHGKPPQCMNLKDFGQDQIIDLYDLTAINVRNLVCSSKLGKYYATDHTYDLQDPGGTSHINSKGHAQAAFMIIQVIMRTSKEIIYRAKNFQNTVKSIATSTATFILARSPHVVETPQCWSRLTHNYKYNPQHNTLKIKVVESKGFVRTEGFRIKNTSYSSTEERKDAFGGFLATEQGSEVTISFTVVGTNSQSARSVGIVSRSSSNGGEVEVWLDDNYSKRTYVNLRANADQSIVRIIGTQVTPGNHTLTMHVAKSGMSSLVGVLVGPANGPW